MPSDPRLDNILRALLQPWRPDTTSAEASRLYASAAAVLTTLTNPLNVTLLTTQILTAPAIWSTPDPLRASLRVFSTFQSATLGKMEMEVQGKAGIIGLEEWIGVVVRGANHNVPRWKHLLLLGGVLSAIWEGGKTEGSAGGAGSGGGWGYLVPRVTKRSLEDAFCRAVNLSLERGKSKDLEADVLSLILSHSINGLSQRAKQLIDYDALLPAVVRSIYYSGEGFQSGYFLSKIDNDVVSKDGKMAWPSKSNSFLELQYRLSRPIFTSMSSVARLAGTAVREARDPRAIHAFLSQLSEFSHTLVSQWKMNRLSQVSAIDEGRLIDPDSRRLTLPVVWQILKMALFTTTLILQELTTRVIQSRELSDDRNGPVIASRMLHILRGLYFITTRLGPNAFTSYNFVYMTSIDILTMHEKETEGFVLSISPSNVGIIPDILMNRILDLYFLNTAEHLVTHLSPRTIEELIVPSCSCYLTTTCDPNLHALFEAAHSVMLAVIASPKAAPAAGTDSTSTNAAQNTVETILPFYTDIIFKSFPSGLSRRQFRLAFSTLVKVCEMPGRSGGHEVMAMGFERAKAAKEVPVPDENPMMLGAIVGAGQPISSTASVTGGPATTTAVKTETIVTTTTVNTVTTRPPEDLTSTGTTQKDNLLPPPAFSEKEILVCALIDSLPHMSPPTLTKWLTPVARLVAEDINDVHARARLRARFWEALSGEMDIERAEVGVRWWSEGGRELLLSDTPTAVGASFPDENVDQHTPFTRRRKKEEKEKRAREVHGEDTVEEGKKNEEKVEVKAEKRVVTNLTGPVLAKL